MTTFKTWVPEPQALERMRLETFPFREAECKDCRFANVCRVASESLPLVVRGPSLPARTYHCDTMGIDLCMCTVVSVKREVAEAEKQVSVERPSPMYMLDTNIFLNAYTQEPKMGEVCAWVLGAGMRIATTDQVLQKELFETHGHSLPERLEVVKVGQIDRWIMELRPAAGLKELSDVDRSLIQAALMCKDCRGIVTFDPDFDNCAVSGLLTSRTGRKVEVMNAFVLRHRFS